MTISPVVFDEFGRVLLGYTKPVTSSYLGFSGENFDPWSVILAGSTVVGWPNLGIKSDLRVTGTTTLDGALVVGIPWSGQKARKGSVKADLHVSGNTTTDGFFNSSRNTGSATFGAGDSVVVFIEDLPASAGAVATFAEAPVVNNPIFTDNIQGGRITFKSTGNTGKRFWYWVVTR